MVLGIDSLKPSSKKSFEKIWQIEDETLTLQSQLKSNGYESCLEFFRKFTGKMMRQDECLSG